MRNNCLWRVDQYLFFIFIFKNYILTRNNLYNHPISWITQTNRTFYNMRFNKVSEIPAKWYSLLVYGLGHATIKGCPPPPLLIALPRGIHVDYLWTHFSPQLLVINKHRLPFPIFPVIIRKPFVPSTFR